MTRWFALFPILLLSALLIAVCALSVAINWEVGVIFGGDITYFKGYSLTSGHVWGAVLVLLSLSQLCWGPLAVKGWAAKSGLMISIAVPMILICFSFSMAAGLAWQYAREDLRARGSQAVAQRWESSTKLITHYSAAGVQIEPRARGVIEADIKVLLAKTVRWRGVTRSIGHLTAGCTKDHRAARRTCQKVLAFNKELARRGAYDERETKLAAAEKKQSANLVLNTNKLFEYFQAHWSIEPDQLLQVRMVSFQGVVEILQPLLPLCILWFWNGMTGQAPPQNPRHGDKINDAYNGAVPVSNGASFRVIDGGAKNSVITRVDKTALLQRYLREARLGETAYAPRDFIEMINRWCAQHGHPRFHQKEVGGVWQAIGGQKNRYYVPTTNNNTSARWEWVLPQKGQARLGLGAAA